MCKQGESAGSVLGHLSCHMCRTEAQQIGLVLQTSQVCTLKDVGVSEAAVQRLLGRRVVDTSEAKRLAATAQRSYLARVVQPLPKCLPYLEDSSKLINLSHLKLYGTNQSDSCSWTLLT